MRTSSLLVTEPEEAFSRSILMKVPSMMRKKVVQEYSQLPPFPFSLVGDVQSLVFRNHENEKVPILMAHQE